MSAADGSPLSVKGRKWVTFSVPNKIKHNFPVFVVDNLANDCILGADFLTRTKAVANFSDKSLSFPPNISISLLSATPLLEDANISSDDLPEVLCPSHTSLPPFSSRTICGQIIYPQNFLPLPQNSLAECHGCPDEILNGLIQIQDDSKAAISCINTSAYTKHIPKGTTLAHLTALPNEEHLLKLLPATDISPIMLQSTSANIDTIQNMPETLAQPCGVAVTNATWNPRYKRQRPTKKPSTHKPIDKDKFLFLQKELKVLAPAHETGKYWALVKQFLDVFSKDDSDLGFARAIEHDIKLKSDDPIHIKQFRIPFSQRAFIENKVKKLVQLGVLEDSTSPYNTPIFAIPKKPVPGQPQSYRLIQDLRAINDHTLLDKYNLADIRDCLDRVGSRNASVFSSLDLTSGFFQIAIKPSARRFTAFTIPGMGKFQWARVCLGLHGAPSTFAKLMALVMAGLPQAMVYLDDVLVASSSHDAHISELKECFLRLRKHNLKLNPFKTTLASTSVQYLGHTINKQGISTSDLKHDAIKKFPIPTSRQAVRQFVGLANFYRQLIPNFNHYAGHLTALTKDLAQYRGGDMPPQAQEAFHYLKEKLCERPIVSFPNPNLPFELYTDACSGDDNNHGGLGAVLIQRTNGHPRTIAYASRGLASNEKNYSAFLLEMAAIVWAIDHFSVYLAHSHFTVFTDHKPIPKMSKVHKKTFHRLHQLMNEYRCEIVYKKGADNAVADALSRNAIISPINTFAPFRSIQQLAELQRADPFCAQLIAAVKSPTAAKHADPQFSKAIHYFAPFCSIQPNNLLSISASTSHDGFKPRIVIPKAAQQDIIFEAHCSRFSGHQSTNKTLMRIQEHYWWLSMAADIANFIKSCHTCQMTNDPFQHHTRLAPFKPLDTPDRPNQRVHADLFGPLLKTASGNTWILVVTDAFTKFTRAIALPNKEAKTVASAIFNAWISLFGPMAILITDNGKEFSNALNKELCSFLQIDRRFTSSIHPQTNAAAESFNKWIIHYIKSSKITDDSDWDELLAPMILAYNTTVHDSTTKSPYFLTFGLQPRTAINPTLPPAKLTSPWASHQAKILTQARATVAKNIESTRAKIKKQQKAVTLKHFEPHQLIYIYYPKSAIPGQKGNPKLHCNWVPGKILEKINSLTYKVLRQDGRGAFLAHINRLKPLRPISFAPPTDHSLPLPATKHRTIHHRSPSPISSPPLNYSSGKNPANLVFDDSNFECISFLSPATPAATPPPSPIPQHLNSNTQPAGDPTAHNISSSSDDSFVTLNDNSDSSASLQLLLSPSSSPISDPLSPDIFASNSSAPPCSTLQASTPKISSSSALSHATKRLQASSIEKHSQVDYPQPSNQEAHQDHSAENYPRRNRNLQGPPSIARPVLPADPPSHDNAQAPVPGNALSSLSALRSRSSRRLESGPPQQPSATRDPEASVANVPNCQIRPNPPPSSGPICPPPRRGRPPSAPARATTTSTSSTIKSAPSKPATESDTSTSAAKKQPSINPIVRANSRHRSPAVLHPPGSVFHSPPANNTRAATQARFLSDSRSLAAAGQAPPESLNRPLAANEHVSSAAAAAGPSSNAAPPSANATPIVYLITDDSTLRSVPSGTSPRRGGLSPTTSSSHS